MTAFASDAAAGSQWRNFARCLGEDPELFFPIGTVGPALAQIEQAKQVCASCPVRHHCLECAVDTLSDHGVWGGLTDLERRAFKRRRRRVRSTLER